MKLLLFTGGDTEAISIHRDIKSPNVLLVERPSSDYRKAQWMGKLGDFGLSRMVLRGKERVQSSLEDRPMAWRRRFIHGRVGTLEWMAPEILDGNQKYGPPIDVYSFAILMWYVDLSLSLCLLLLRSFYRYISQGKRVLRASMESAST